MQGVDLIMTITDRDRCEDFTAWFRSQGIPLVLTALGQGTATTEILDCLGLENSEKAVLFCVAPRSPRLIRRAARELWLDVPGNGILMAVPVDSIGGQTAKEYLLHQQEGESPMTEKEKTHELIVVIANQGYTDQVMDAARAAGATGGTAVHAKGTGDGASRHEQQGPIPGVLPAGQRSCGIADSGYGRMKNRPTAECGGPVFYSSPRSRARAFTLRS